MTARKILLAALTVTAALSLAACSSNNDTAATNTSVAAASEVDDQAAANKHIMERFTSEFLPAGDPTLAEEFIDPNIVMFFGGPQQQGRDSYLAIVHANSEAFPDLKWTVEDMVSEGDTVAVRYTMNGTQEGVFAGVQPTGRAVTAQSMAFYKLENGRIIEERAQLDMLTLMQQMGAILTA
ncbi:ester cyclase [Rhodococcus opacus]|nr:ester cyclase [Rhodococcus opacus]